MKAVRIHEDGGPEVLRYEDVPDPEPGPGEVLVRLRAASLNHLDIWVRRGLPSVPKPRILGADGAGVVEALGEGVERLRSRRPGRDQPRARARVDDHGRRRAHRRHARRADRGPRRAGLRARRARSRSRRRRRSRSSSRPPTGCSSPRRGCRRASGCSSGASAAGSRPRRSSSRGRSVRARSSPPARDEKLERAREWGADVAVNHANGDVVAAGQGGDRRRRRRRRRDGRRGDLGSARSPPCGPHGRVVVCGATSGPNPPAQLHRFWWKQLDVLGSTMGTREDFLGAYELVRTGRARVTSTRCSRSSEIRAAHERLEAGEQLGKIVLSIP